MSIYMWREGPDYLCFTANTASSTVALTKIGSPTSVTLEISTDGSTWTTYTMGNTITLNNIGDKLYFRNTSETTTGFSIDGGNFYNFDMTGSIAGSGDITYLINKNGSNSVSSYCFFYLFEDCSSLTTTPELPATTLSDNCYRNMFYKCTNLETLPKLPAQTLYQNSYNAMFGKCSKIKLSTTQTGEYQTEYRIPSIGIGTDTTGSLQGMFNNTGGTFADTPTINTTYYTSNTVI